MLPVIKTRDNVSLFVAEKENIPFEIKRFFVIYGFNENNIIRGCHAHRQCQQMIFCLSGSVNIKLTSNNLNSIFHLDTPNYGLYISPMTWNELLDIKKDSVILVLASEEYDEKDYIRNYDEFIRML